MPFDIDNLFTRVWKFVDHREAGQTVTRADLDIALDDVAAGLNHLAEDMETVATEAAAEATSAASAAVADYLDDTLEAATTAEDAALAAAASAAAAEAQVLAVEALMLNWRGPWETAAVYEVADLSQKDGNVYYCLEPHTAGTFATDLAAAKWELFVSKGSTGAGAGDMLNSDNLSGLTNKAAARSNLGLGSTALQNFMPVEQGGGSGQGANKIRIGWHTGGISMKGQVDATDLGFIVFNPWAGGWDAAKIYAAGAAPLYAVRSWGKIAASGAIEGGGNVASCARSGGGYFTVNFSIAMPDTAYTVVFGSGRCNFEVVARGTSSFTVHLRDHNDSLVYRNFDFAVLR
jgi:hypothetical protein